MTLYTTGVVLAGIVVTDAGDVYVSAPELNQIGRLAAAGGAFTIVAGNGSRGYRDGPAALAMFNHPTGLAHDPGSGRIFIADQLNHCVRVYDPASGSVSTLFRGLPYPHAVQYGLGRRQLFVQHGPPNSTAIRRLDPSGAVSVVVANYSVGDEPLPTRLGSRMALAGANGDVVFVARTDRNRVDRLDAHSGRISELRTLLNPASVDKVMFAPIGVAAGQRDELVVFEPHLAYRVDLGSGSLRLLSGYQERVQYGVERGPGVSMRAAHLHADNLYFVEEEQQTPSGPGHRTGSTYRIRKVALD